MNLKNICVWCRAIYVWGRLQQQMEQLACHYQQTLAWTTTVFQTHETNRNTRVLLNIPFREMLCIVMKARMSWGEMLWAWHQAGSEGFAKWKKDGTKERSPPSLPSSDFPTCLSQDTYKKWDTSPKLVLKLFDCLLSLANLTSTIYKYLLQ